MKYDVKDIKLADKGKLRHERANQSMPVLKFIRKRFEKEKPLKGIRIAAWLHVTTETASLMQTLKGDGADVVICASNPLSTQDDVAASLVKYDKIPTFAIKGEDGKTYCKHIMSSLERRFRVRGCRLWLVRQRARSPSQGHGRQRRGDRD